MDKNRINCMFYYENMSQQSKQTRLAVNVNASPRKTSKVRFADIDEPTQHTQDNTTNNATTTKKQKVHVNVLLEGSSYNIVGFVIIKDNNDDLLTLFSIRKCIKLQFDEDQLAALGGSDAYKFLRNSIPISKKQEKLINISEIAISDIENLKLLKQASFKHPKSNKITFNKNMLPLGY